MQSIAVAMITEAVDRRNQKCQARQIIREFWCHLTLEFTYYEFIKGGSKGK